MIKITGLTAVFICCCLLGMSKTSKLNRRLSELKLIRRMLCEFCIMLEYNCSTVLELIKSSAHNKELSRLEFLSCDKNAADISSSVVKAVSQWQTDITSDEKDRLISVFEELGTTDLNGQLAMLSYNKEYFQRSIEELEKSKPMKARLYNSLGFLGGIFAVVMLM